jgi:hypothetical protein
LVAVVTSPPALAAGSPLEPVRVTVSAPARVAIDPPIAVHVTVDADREAFAQTTHPVRVRVRLAGECASTFASTPGPVLLDRRLSLVPTSSAPHRETLQGSGRAHTYGVQTLCAFVEEEGDDRLYGAQDSSQVDVSLPCTIASRHHAGLLHRIARARRLAASVHGRRRVLRRAKLRRLLAQLPRRARARSRACSP